MVGFSAGHDTSVVRGTPGDGPFARFYLRGGRLIAVDAINSPKEFMAVRRVIADMPPVDEPERLADTGTAVQELL